MKIKNKSPCSLFYVSLISLPLCCRRSGICRGTGAAHGPSAQYVQAGAEWRRCNSGKKMEILRFWHTEFSVTQEWRTHTLRRHTNVNRCAQCLGPLIHMCVCACSSDTRQCSRQQMTFTQADTGNCESDGFFFLESQKTFHLWMLGSGEITFLFLTADCHHGELQQGVIDYHRSARKTHPLSVLWSESWSLVSCCRCSLESEKSSNNRNITDREFKKNLYQSWTLKDLMPNLISLADKSSPTWSKNWLCKGVFCWASCGMMGPQIDHFLLMVWKGLCTPTLNLSFNKNTYRAL